MRTRGAARIALHRRRLVRRRAAAAAGVLAILTSLAPPVGLPPSNVARAAEAATTRASTDANGLEGDGSSDAAALSGTGRYVAFASRATNLVPGDTNGQYDVFLRDRVANTVTLVSVGIAGAPSNGINYRPSVSDDGRYVAFESSATNLVPDDTNGWSDVFVRDLLLNTTIRVSVDEAGGQANGPSFKGKLSADGTLVAFESSSSNLTPTDTTSIDVFVRDVAAGTLEQMSVDSNGVPGNANTFVEAMSADGRFVVMSSQATNLVASDTNLFDDIFVRDRTTATTTRVSLDAVGGQSNGDSLYASISGDGRYVAFVSSATDLVAGDTNGQLDVFVYDREEGATSRVSVETEGGQAVGGGSVRPAMSRDGSVVAFDSLATNLVAGDANNRFDVFLRYLDSGVTTRASVKSSGSQANGNSTAVALSSDASTVAFESIATNLVDGDTNGASDVFIREPGPPPSGLTEFVYVHGITSNYLNPRFASLLDQLEADYPNRRTDFEYIQDTGSQDCSPPVTLPAEPNGDMPADPDSINDDVCDSQGDLALNAVHLGEVVAARYAASGRKVVLIGHSMGAAIIRGLLAYSAERGDGVVMMIDSAVFIEGAQDGSHVLAGAVNLAHEDNPMAKAVGDLILGAFNPPIDPERPAVAGIAPQSSWYEWANPAPNHLPQLPYFNVFGDIKVTHEKCTWWWCASEPGVLLEIGDGGILPGTDDPFDVAAKGGARMLRGLAPGQQNWQWGLSADVEWTWWNDPLFLNVVGKTLGRSENHRNLPDHLADVVVPDCQDPGQSVSLDVALLRVTRGRLDRSPYECTP